MNSNRKAELQRKLTLASVPKPPAGLAERIKADIPNHLHPVEVKSERFSRSMAFNLRIAASILLLVGSVFVTLRVLSPDAKREVLEMSKAAAPEPQRNVAAPAPTSEVQVQIEQAPAEPVSTSTFAYQPPAPRVAADERRQRDASADHEGFVGEIAGGAAAPASDLAPPPPPPAPAPPPVTPPEMVAESATPSEVPAAPAAAPAPARAEGVVTQKTRLNVIADAQAADLSLAAQKSIFGISVDPEVFQGIKSAIESGRRPNAGSVNVEALVNYFAGPAQRVRNDVALDVEGSTAPFGSDRTRGVLRFTVDTATTAAAADSSIPPVATDAHLAINFDPIAVRSFHRVGDTDEPSKQPMLLKNSSVTGLYELELAPRVSPRQVIATVRLTYKSVRDGRQHTVSRVLRASQFTTTWASASRRHRLASLGAVWGESLKTADGSAEVARRAEELSEQEPHDERARELANVAGEATRLPTGS